MADLPAPSYGVDLAVLDKKIYLTVGDSPVDDVYHQVYVYNVYTDEWNHLPPSGHYYGIPHIIGGRLAIIGGRLSATKKMTNKVSTFDEDSQTWTSYYPDLLSVRSRPGVVSYLEHVIVAGGGLDDNTDHDDIEILNWVENLYWRKVSIKLPVPMFSFTPTISDGDLIIVGYSGANRKGYRKGYKFPIDSITASTDQKPKSTSNTFTNWIELTITDYRNTALVPNSSPLVVVGGRDTTDTPTADIEMYDTSSKSWKKIGSLSSARSDVAIAAVCNNAIIVIGGYTKGGNLANARSSSLTVVELGQAELIC